MLAGVCIFAGGMFTNHLLSKKSPVEQPPAKKFKQRAKYDAGNLLDPISPKEQRMEMMLEAAALKGGNRPDEE